MITAKGCSYTEHTYGATTYLHNTQCHSLIAISWHYS